MEDADSSLHRAAKRSSKKRTADEVAIEESGRVLVLSEQEGYLTHEKGTANRIDFKKAPWNDDRNLLVWVENPRDVESAFGYFNHRKNLTGEYPNLFGVDIEACHGQAIRSAEHFSAISGMTVADHWEHFKEREDHDTFMKRLEELIAEGEDLCTES